MPRSSAQQELNFVVVGAKGAGKSTFVRCALDLKKPPPASIASKKMSLEGEVFLISLIELQLRDVDVAENAILWPHSIQDAGISRVDGVLALYDVTERDTLSGIPSLLNACSKTSTPCVLVSCKCDISETDEQSIDPREVERSCMSETGIEGCQTLVTRPETHKRCISVVLRNLMSNNAALSNSGRPRASTATHWSSKTPSVALSKHGHSRAASEMDMASQVGPLGETSSKGIDRVPLNQIKHKQQMHTMSHDNSIGLKPKMIEEDQDIAESFREKLHLVTDREVGPDKISSYAPLGTPTTIANSFLDMGTESQDEDTSFSEDVAFPPPKPELSFKEDSLVGYSFDELVDRLLAQPMSKADSEFVSVFLCLYRKFAAPAQLLSGICIRFECLSRNGEEALIRVGSQLRYLSVLAQWTSQYPGDFAYPITRQRLLEFTGEIGGNQLFAAAASEVKAQLDSILEDDDTYWLCSDQSRGQTSTLESFQNVPSMKRSIEAMLTRDDEVGLDGIESSLPTKTQSRPLGHSKTSSSISSAGFSEFILSAPSSQVLNSVEAIQRQAELLTPISRITLAKPQWHQFMDTSEEDIARELTRIDWILYSAIKPRDLIRHVSLTPEQKQKCKSLEHVNRMINQFNHVAFWVANMILLRDKAKHRAKALEKFMGVAWRLRHLNNYNSLGAVIAGINGTAVHRLLQTRELVVPQARRDFMRLEILMGTQRSHFAYRLAWDNTVTEKIPFLPLHRRDLVSAEEGNRTFTTDEQDKINWSKFEIMGDTIIGIQKSQGTSHNQIQSNVDIQRLILEGKFSQDDDELYERSVQVEGPGINEPRRRFGNWFREKSRSQAAGADTL